MPFPLPRRALLATSLLAPLARPARAAPYPDRPIRVIVPFAPGGATDLAARILQPFYAEQFGQPVIVENRTGAAGNVGMEAAARATPDGHTLYLGNVGTLAVNPAVFARTLRIDPNKDLAAISLVSETPDALLVRPDLPVRNVAEFIAYARARPGQVNYGSPGAGSLNRLEMELLREQAGGLDMLHIPYQGGAGPAVMAAVAGDVHGLFVTYSSAVAQVQGGRLRAIAVTTAARVPATPEVPTLAESGFPDFIASSWQGLLAPAGTPPEIIARWHAATQAAVARPDIQARFAASVTLAVASAAPADFAAHIAREGERWGALARRAGAVAE
jgi:tripartite-type tricarboxylate transporter receptor subunit TctC